MKKILFTLIIMNFILCNIYAQKGAKIKIEVPEGPVPWNNLEINNNPATFQFAIVTDRTGGHRPGVFLDGVQKLNLLQPEFVMSVGDLIEGYTEDTAQLNWEWNQFNGFIDSLTVPFFYVPGNHDITNKVMEEKWKELFGKTYYHFLYKDVLFLCLNSEDNYRGAGKGTIDEQQFRYIKAALKENKDVKWTLVFMHQPLWNQADTKRWKAVELLLKDRKHTVFVGHNHRYRKYDRNNGKYFILATTGGGSALRGPNFGEFDHVVWITMTDQGPILANLLLEGIWDENVMTNEFADFIFPISNNFPVQITPIFVDAPKFGKGTTKLKISNSSDYDMNITMEFSGSKNLIVDHPYIEHHINPNDVEEFELEIQGIKVDNLNDIDDLGIEVMLHYEVKDRPEVEMGRNFNIRPEKRLTALPTKKSFAIDGNLKDWGKLEYQLAENAIIYADPFSHKGMKDASSAFSVRYDNNFIYIAALVTDDDIMVKEEGNPLYQDAVVIMIDGRPVNESSMNHGQNMFSDWIMLAVTPDSKGTIYRKERLPERTKCILHKTKNTYEIEAAIPVNYLNDKQIGQWKSFRFNLMINDYDQSGNHHTKLSWKPLWNEDDNYIGSGTFFR